MTNEPVYQRETERRPRERQSSTRGQVETSRRKKDGRWCACGEAGLRCCGPEESLDRGEAAEASEPRGVDAGGFGERGESRVPEILHDRLGRVVVPKPPPCLQRMLAGRHILLLHTNLLRQRGAKTVGRKSSSRAENTPEERGESRAETTRRGQAGGTAKTTGGRARRSAQRAALGKARRQRSEADSPFGAEERRTQRGSRAEENLARGDRMR
ncbi:hypothetical protein TGFOU_402500 [Toxoplasma gondii FOU]|uniref:Uncharacterized protein n=1 Tax=Toxoplasma gondii FOU TaxID=943167 RepID=A0A086LI40_TOXGO|nr:hypothetical protein TGFOU_402500 [Toxoplasma gondii FOU]